MSYNPQWANGNLGRVEGGEHLPRLGDGLELGEAINRRRRLIYATYDQDCSSHLHSGAYVRARTFSGMAPPPFQDFRGAFIGTLLEPSGGQLGGSPLSPTSMRWICTSGSGAGKLFTSSSSPSADQVNFFSVLNGGTY